MSDASPFELPSAHEKQAYKFILDCLKESQIEEAEAEAVVAATITPETTPTMETAFRPEPLPADKKYFRIGEVAELIGVEAYVLRYWETEFRLVRPTKSGSGHRVYARKDVEALQWIRHLLHVEKFSIKGAKQKLQEMRSSRLTSPESPIVAVAAAPAGSPEFLKSLAHDLRQLIQVARGNPGVMSDT